MRCCKLYCLYCSVPGGRHLWTVQYALQKTSDDMEIAWKENNLQITSLFNAHRNATEKISQQYSHFRIFIQKCVWTRIALIKGDTKRSLTIRDYTKPSRKCPSGVAAPLLLFSFRSAAPARFSSLFRWLRPAAAIAKDSIPYDPDPTNNKASLGAQQISGTPLASLRLAPSMLRICLVLHAFCCAHCTICTALYTTLVGLCLYSQPACYFMCCLMSTTFSGHYKC